MTRGNAYRVYVAAFLLTLGPFTFFNLSKTKYLQVVIVIIGFLPETWLKLYMLRYPIYAAEQSHFCQMNPVFIFESADVHHSDAVAGFHHNGRPRCDQTG